MRNLMYVCLVLVISGCATLSKSECYSANWYMIGMEDGVSGKSTSSIGKHRKACAKYNVMPDLDEYLSGHKEGVHQYCTKTNGFESGQRGNKYHNVCPAEVQDEFMEGYQLGRKLFNMRQEIERTSRRVKTERNKLRDLKDEINEKKSWLISKDSTEKERAVWIEEIDQMALEIYKIEELIRELERSILIKTNEYEQLKNSGLY